jgi:hypothetical protein
MYEEGHADYAARYDDYVGYFRLEAKGNKGSFVRVHLYFTGFFMRIVPTLSYTQRYRTPYDVKAPDYDQFFIIPRNVSATVTVGVEEKKKCKKSISYRRFDGSLSREYQFPPPPNLKSRDGSIPRWMYAWSRKYKRKFEFTLLVKSRAAVGGPIQLFPSFYVRVPGSGPPNSYTIVFRATKPRYYTLDIDHFGTYWKLAGPVSLPQFSLEDISMKCSGSATYYPRTLCGEILSDTVYHVSYQLVIAAKKKVKAVLRSADENAETWLPTPGDVRTYRLTLEDPGHEEVSAVRFILEDTSSHPGIATNAGNHVRFDQCPDCTLGKKVERTSCTEVFSGATLQRSYAHYNACPLDSLPDVFFSSRENPGFDLSEDGINQNLQYTISQKAYLEPVDQDEITIKVTVMDGAASSRLRAEVMVGGLWFPAQAEGPDAESDGLRLMIPVDRDNNGLADRWEDIFKTYDPGEDAESSPGASHPGDGLTAFEEYRGIYSRGRFAWPSPKEKDVFVHDYSGQYGDELNEVASFFQRYNLTLWQLNGDEFRNEIVNYQESKYKKGDQYAIVVMALSQCPGVDLSKWTSGRAAHVGPPTRDHHTALMRDFVGGDFPLAQFVSYHTSEGTLAHELGHLMNLPHHGDKDRMMKVDSSGEEAWVACRGGQHSGRKDCIMRYNCARYFLDMDFIPQSAITRFVLGVRDKLQPFSDYGQENMFCKDAQGDSVCGPATCGACLERINVKSY